MLRILSSLLHIDRLLGSILLQYGTWTYALLFVIIFCETGLVVTPFLPGDSLLFGAGALASLKLLNLAALFLLFITAAILGDTANYWIGRKIGKKIFETDHHVRFIKREHYEKAKQFYAKYGAKTILLARFVPIVRTFAPFIAGVSEMRYRTFLIYNVIGGVLWVTLFTVAGYLFGNIPTVQENFTLVILAIILLSIIPMMVEWARSRSEKIPPS